MNSNASEKKFHRDAYGLPKFTLTRLEGFTLTFHARERLVEKRIAVNLGLLSVLDAGWSIFEVVTVNGVVAKVAARRQLDAVNDVCAVFALADRRVVTAWTNRRTDTHRTLDRSLYSRPQS